MLDLRNEKVRARGGGVDGRSSSSSWRMTPKQEDTCAEKRFCRDLFLVSTNTELCDMVLTDSEETCSVACVVYGESGLKRCGLCVFVVSRQSRAWVLVSRAKETIH
jgi:hypothetical protein